MPLQKSLTAFVVVAIGALSGCAYLAGLIPQEMYYEVALTPVIPKGQGEYQSDPDDPQTVIFSHEGMVVKIRPYTDAELNELYPPLFDGRHTNPYTTNQLDIDLGYVPPIFLVFDVEVINETYAKIEFDPAKTLLTTDTGKKMRYYDPGVRGKGSIRWVATSLARIIKPKWGVRDWTRILISSAWGLSTKRPSTAFVRFFAATSARANWPSIVCRKM